MDRRFLVILAALVVIFGGIFVVSQGSNNNKNSSNGSQSSSAQPTNHVEGQGSTGVKLVEYGDFECPICAEYYKTVNQIASQYSQQIYFQYRNLPLTQIHPNAFASARAAEAAGMQSKYWQMHDLLYKNQNSWASSGDPLTLFDGYAKQLGLNVSQFNTDYASDKVNNSINADVAAFNKTGQQMATPTFFLDGKYIDNTQLADPQTGAPSLQKFQSVINAEITAKQKSSKSQSQY